MTFFEPPENGGRRACAGPADPRALELVAADARRVYVDLHYGARPAPITGDLAPID